MICRKLNSIVVVFVIATALLYHIQFWEIVICDHAWLDINFISLCLRNPVCCESVFFNLRFGHLKSFRIKLQEFTLNYLLHIFLFFLKVFHFTLFKLIPPHSFGNRSQLNVILIDNGDFFHVCIVFVYCEISACMYILKFIIIRFFYYYFLAVA